jgi:hypothetical protein
MSTSFARIPVAILAAALAACADPTAAPLATSAPDDAVAAVTDETAQNQLLATIREATASYHVVDAALADGYVLASECEAIPEGGIGVHYRKSSLFDVVVDPAQPELLVYEPQQNGDLRLVAVAFVVPAAPWDASHSAAPTLGLQTLEDKRVPDWSSPPFPTYELHVWVWQHNPNGIYATINPTVSCEFAG